MFLLALVKYVAVYVGPSNVLILCGVMDILRRPAAGQSSFDMVDQLESVVECPTWRHIWVSIPVSWSESHSLALDPYGVLVQ